MPEESFPHPAFEFQLEMKREFTCTCGLQVKLCMAGPLPVLMHEHPICDEFNENASSYAKWLTDGGVEA